MRASETEAKDTRPRPWTPAKYMLQSVRWLLEHGGAGLFLDPGLGKTSINLAAIKVLKEEGELAHAPALVVCELRPLYNVWDPSNPEGEPFKWTDFHGLDFQMLHGDEKDEALKKKCDIRLINPEGLPWYFSKVRVPPSRFPLLDVDESTLFKHANTQRFKLLRGWLPAFRRRWINTGTPSPNGLLDLFGQIYILDMGAALGAYITHYRRKFFQPTGYGGYTWVLQGQDEKGQEETEQRIHKAISPLVLSMSEDDYLKLPPLHGALFKSKEPAYVRVKMPPAAQKKYDELEENFFAELEDGMVTAANAGTKHMKLRQAANGGIYLDREVLPDGGWVKKRKWTHLHDAKTEAAVELAEGFDGRGCVIAIEFHHDVERLRMHKHFRNTVCVGEGTLKDDVLIAQDWNAGRIKEIICNPASFSRGSNMQRGGDALIFHSIIWNLEHYIQLVRRFYRQGRTRPFYVRHIVAEGTQDMFICHQLGRKNGTQAGMLAALRKASKMRLRLHSG